MKIKQDLERSGLNSKTIELMDVKELNRDELKPLLGSKYNLLLPSSIAYSIPYHDFDGRFNGFYRARFLPPIREERRVDVPGSEGKVTFKSIEETKYTQPRNTLPHVYIPRSSNFDKKDWFNTSIPLVITEGEKKAAKACQEGILCLGLGGVWNWVRHSIKVPNTSISMNGTGKDSIIHIKTPGELESWVVYELMEIPLYGRIVYTCFDSDYSEKENVQDSAFHLSLYLESRGSTHRQILLPQNAPDQKTGLDDFLIANSAEDFWDLPKIKPNCPNLYDKIRNTLNRKNIKRTDYVELAHGALHKLDSGGTRYMDKNSKDTHYWCAESKSLFPTNNTTSFGEILYKEFGITTADKPLYSRLMELFPIVEGIQEVTPRKQSYAFGPALYFQLSDSTLARVSPQSIDVVDNGTDGVLFRSGVIRQPPDLPLLLSLIREGKPSSPAWPNILQEVNLQPLFSLTPHETRLVVAALFYLSPTFREWNGLALPVEIYASEPASGKTFLMNLRTAILLGAPTIENPPLKADDFRAQVANAPGIWICDNLGDIPREALNVIQNELAHILTSSDRVIKTRKLYTNSETHEALVDSIFVFTSTRNRFTNTDIMQRAIEIHLKAIPHGYRDSNWYSRKIEAGGRELLLADHLLTAQKFLQRAEMYWISNYTSLHRLPQFEQALRIMIQVLDPRVDINALLERFSGSTQEAIVSANPILDSLRNWANWWRERYKTNPGLLANPSAIVDWATGFDENASNLRVLSEARSVRRWIDENLYEVRSTCGIIPKKSGNQTLYQVVDPKTLAVEEEENE